MLAAIRPDSWNLPLLVHVAGAMLLVASLVVVIALVAAALRRGEDVAVLTRLGFRGLLLGVLPAYVVMRAGAEWIASKESVPDDVAWLGIGRSTADGGLLVIIIATVLAWRAARRGTDGPGGVGRAAVVLTGLVLVAYLVAIWAMTTKPT
jgi:hypothetical protein